MKQILKDKIERVMDIIIIVLALVVGGIVIAIDAKHPTGVAFGVINAIIGTVWAVKRLRYYREHPLK